MPGIILESTSSPVQLSSKSYIFTRDRVINLSHETSLKDSRTPKPLSNNIITSSDVQLTPIPNLVNNKRRSSLFPRITGVKFDFEGRRNSISNMMRQVRSSSVSGFRRLTSMFTRTSKIPAHFDAEAEDRMIKEVRIKILDYVERTPNCATQEDIDWIKSVDEMILRYLVDHIEGHHSDTEEEIVEKVISNILKTLKWRFDEKIDILKQKDFPWEFYTCNLVGEYIGLDDRLYIFLRGNKFKKAGEWTPALLHFCAFELDKKIRRFAKVSHSGILEKRAVVVLDARGVGLSQVDLSFVFAIKTMLLDHYPRVGQELWIFGLPWFGRSILNLVLKTLPAHYQERLKVMTLTEGISEVGEENLPLFMGGKHPDPSTDIPEVGCSLEECGKRNGVSKSEIKRMTDHLRQIIEGKK